MLLGCSPLSLVLERLHDSHPLGVQSRRLWHQPSSREAPKRGTTSFHGPPALLDIRLSHLPWQFRETAAYFYERVDGRTIQIASVPPSGSLAASGQVYSIQLPLESHGGEKGISDGTCWAWFLLGDRPHQVTFCRSRLSRSGRGELSPVADSATSLLYEVSWVRAALLADVSLMLLAVALKTGSVVFQRCLSPAVLTTPTSATGSSNLIVNHCRAKGRSC